MPRKICVTSVDGHTGFAIAELILQHRDFSRKVEAVVGLALNADSERAQELQSLGAQIVQHKPGRVREMVKALQGTDCDTICLVPPAHQDKYDICRELVEAAKKAEITNVLFLSSAGCDYATAEKQPRLREFIDLETLVLQCKGDASTPTGGSPCVIRYACTLQLHTVIYRDRVINNLDTAPGFMRRIYCFMKKWPRKSLRLPCPLVKITNLLRLLSVYVIPILDFSFCCLM